jgi:hypothetical protein
MKRLLQFFKSLKERFTYHGSYRCPMCWGHNVDCHFCFASKDDPAEPPC